MKKMIWKMNAFSFAFVAVLLAAVTASAQILPDRLFASNVSQATRDHIQSDMAFTASLQSDGGTPLFHQMFQADFNGAGLMTFLQKRINRFEMDRTNDPGVAYVNPEAGRHTMWMGRDYVAYDIPQVLRMSIIFHESRHTESTSNFWMHAICPRHYTDDEGKPLIGIMTGKKLAGKDACDTTLAGAYGVEAVLLKNIEAHCTNCNEKIQMDAQLYGDDMMKRLIVKEHRAKIWKDSELAPK